MRLPSLALPLLPQTLRRPRPPGHCHMVTAAITRWHSAGSSVIIGEQASGIRRYAAASRNILGEDDGHDERETLVRTEAWYQHKWHKARRRRDPETCIRRAIGRYRSLWSLDASRQLGADGPHHGIYLHVGASVSMKSAWKVFKRPPVRRLIQSEVGQDHIHSHPAAQTPRPAQLSPAGRTQYTLSRSLFTDDNIGDGFTSSQE